MKTSPTMQSTYARQMVSHLASIATADIPDSAKDAAKRVLLDTYACAIAGQSSPGIEAVLEQMRDWGGKPESAILFTADRLPMPNAAFANAAMIHALDFDDVYTPGTLHLTSVIVPAMLAAGEVAHADGQDMLAAMILGIELAARIGVAERTRRRGGGFLPTSLAGGFGAVITAARLLALTEQQTVHALGINYAQAAGNRQALLDASLTKRLQPAFAARSALWAVALAHRGITGPERMFEGDAGYFNVYMNGDVPDVAELLPPLCDYAVEHVSTKRYPSCGACHPVQIAAEKLREEEHLDPCDIKRVETFGVAPLVSEPFRLDQPQVAAQFSAAWAVAHTLLRGPARLADYTDEAIRGDREVCALTRRITNVPTPDDVPDATPAEGENAYRSRYQGVIVHTTDDRRLMRAHSPAQTFPQGPASWEDIERKLRECVTFAGRSEEAAESVIMALKQSGGIAAKELVSLLQYP